MPLPHRVMAPRLPPTRTHTRLFKHGYTKGGMSRTSSQLGADAAHRDIGGLRLAEGMKNGG